MGDIVNLVQVTTGWYTFHPDGWNGTAVSKYEVWDVIADGTVYMRPERGSTFKIGFTDFAAMVEHGFYQKVPDGEHH